MHKLAPAQWELSLTPEERRALRDWKADSRPFRHFQLTGSGSAKIARSLKILEAALDRAEPYRGPIILRGLHDVTKETLQNLLEQEFILLNALESGTKSELFALTFAQPSKPGAGASVIIEVSQNLSGVDITPVHPSEEEIILRRGTRLRVLASRRETVMLHHSQFEVYRISCVEEPS